MSFHDEPLVFDNGPFCMDIGKAHQDKTGLFSGPTPTTNGEKWLRKASDPERILVQVTTTAGEVEEFKTTNLDTHDGIKFTLKNPGGTGTGEVILSWSGITEDELTIESVGFEFQRNGRRLTAKNGSLRIAKVEWNDGDEDHEVDLNSSGSGSGVRHSSVVVALF